MIEKVVSKHSLHEDSELRDLQYWDTKTPEERWQAVQYLREQFYGKNDKVERVIHMRKLGQDPSEALTVEEFHKKYPY